MVYIGLSESNNGIWYQPKKDMNIQCHIAGMDRLIQINTDHGIMTFFGWGAGAGAGAGTLNQQIATLITPWNVEIRMDCKNLEGTKLVVNIKLKTHCNKIQHQ